jgi:hypothetical protein
MSGKTWGPTMLALLLDIGLPLAIFYGARAAGVDAWLAVLLGAVGPVAGNVLSWRRQRHLDTTAIFIIVAMALSLVVALFTGDARALLARESWITGALGLWMLVSLAMARPFMLDIAIKISPPAVGERYEQLWRDNAVFHRWIRVASLAWGASFVLDALARVVMAYTLPIDEVPLLSVLLLVGMLVVAQGGVMVLGWRSGALALTKRDKRDAHV